MEPAAGFSGAHERIQRPHLLAYPENHCEQRGRAGRYAGDIHQSVPLVHDRSRSFTAWLYRIATNEALRIIDKRHPTVNVEDNADVMSMQADEYIDLSDVEAVNLQKAILSLTRKQQITFNLRYYDELGFEEIAEITDSTPGSAKANWHNAKVKIYNYLKEYYD